MNDSRHTGGPGLGLAGGFLERRPREDPVCRARARQQPDSCLVNYAQWLSVKCSRLCPRASHGGGINKAACGLRAACLLWR